MQLYKQQSLRSARGASKIRVNFLPKQRARVFLRFHVFQPWRPRRKEQKKNTHRISTKMHSSSGRSNIFVTLEHANDKRQRNLPLSRNVGRICEQVELMKLVTLNKSLFVDSLKNTQNRLYFNGKRQMPPSYVLSTICKQSHFRSILVQFTNCHLQNILNCHLKKKG